MLHICDVCGKSIFLFFASLREIKLNRKDTKNTQRTQSFSQSNSCNSFQFVLKKKFTFHISPFTSNFSLLSSYLASSMTEYFKIGKIVAVHGLKGEVILRHELGKKTSLKGLAAIFIEDRKDSFLPWFITGTKIKSDTEIYLQLETLATREAAAKLNQKEVWLNETDFKKFAAKSAPVNLLGYTIINSGEALGEILEVIEQPHQLLCRLEIKSKEVLIPLNENFLLKVDHKKREVHVELPEGLLEIYV